MPQSIHALCFIIFWLQTLGVDGFGKVQATKGFDGLCAGLPISFCGTLGGTHISSQEGSWSLPQSNTCHNKL